jgi:glycosyltransferase involved in cell wall biosynthesis
VSELRTRRHEQGSVRPIPATRGRRPTVAIVYRAVFQYRRAFYERLRERLDELGIDFRLIFGQPGGHDRQKKDTLDPSWGFPIENRIWRLGGNELYWQPCLHLLKDVDLVIVEQANKLLLNLVLILGRSLGSRRVAFWGHGKDFQASRSNRWRDRVKQLLATRVDWWFAYNETARKVVANLGYPPSRITSVENSIDTRELREEKALVTAADLELQRGRLGLVGRNVCVYAGGMYKEKRLPFLIEACKLVRRAIPDFEMLFLGAGPDEGVVIEAARELPWLHHVGPRFDREKVPYFLLSKLSLMPGLVGLVVLDAFALEVPLVTTNISYHSPEIEYLEHGVNGWLVNDANDPAEYARAVVHLLRDDARRAGLVAGCQEAARRYSTEAMVEHFAQGVLGALGLPVDRPEGVTERSARGG